MKGLSQQPPNISVRCAACAVRAKRHAKLQASVEQLMTLVLRTINEKKDHIPPVTSAAVLTFPFEITVAGCACRCVSARSSAHQVCIELGSSSAGNMHGPDDLQDQPLDIAMSTPTLCPCSQGWKHRLRAGDDEATAHAHQSPASAELRRLPTKLHWHFKCSAGEPEVHDTGVPQLGPCRDSVSQGAQS